MCHLKTSADNTEKTGTTSMNNESWKLHFFFHTILIASLNVTLNSFNLLAWLLSFLLHACSGGEPSSKSSWLLQKKKASHNKIRCPHWLLKSSYQQHKSNRISFWQACDVLVGNIMVVICRFYCSIEPAKFLIQQQTTEKMQLSDLQQSIKQAYG